MQSTARKNIVKTNVEGFEKDLNTNLVVSSDSSYRAFIQSRKEREDKIKNENEIRDLKNTVNMMKENLDQLQHLILRVVNGKPNC